MIRYLTGTVISVTEELLCLDVSGFGMEIYASAKLSHMATVGETLTCQVYLQISEAGQNLFGFTDDMERALFLELMQVKTMGGKLSMALLRHLSAESIIKAIMMQDAASLSVPGVGIKRAERICFELKAKVEKKYAEYLSGEITPLAAKSSLDLLVQDGLMGLGFSQMEASRVIALCKKESKSESWTEESLMKAALTQLQKKKV